MIKTFFTTTNTPIWRNIEGYEGLYMISNQGEVLSLKSKKILKPVDNGKGYLAVKLYKDSKAKMFKIHRLVAVAFIPNPDNLPQVNHKDEDKQNNCVSNLEWISAKDNANYGTRNKRISKKVLCIESGKIFESVTAAAKIFFSKK